MPAALSAAALSDGTLSVKRGRALIVVKLRGTAIGSLANGSVRIRDLAPLDAHSPRFRHCRTIRPIDPATNVCKGRRISFRALDGAYLVTVKGTGTFLSAAGRGSVTLDGSGDGTYPSGVMSFNDDPYEPIPLDPTTYPLGSSSAGH